MEDIYLFLKRVELFSTFDLKELEKISLLFKNEAYEEESVLFKEGDPARGLYVVESGLIKATKGVEGRGKKIVATYGARDFFGEMAFLGDGYTYSVTTQVLRPSSLFFLSRQDFETLRKNEPLIALRLITTIARIIEERLMASHEEIVSLASWGKEIREIKTKFREIIDGGEEIRIVLTNDRQLLGRIEGYSQGIGGIEILFRGSTGHLLIIPYRAIQYFIIQEANKIEEKEKP